MNQKQKQKRKQKRKKGGTRMRKLSVILAAWALGAAAAANADDLRLGTPSYGGSGCPAGSASVSLTEDQKTISILFDQYLAQAGGNGQQIDRKACNLAIPVHVPQGYSVSIFEVDYRGFASIPRGGSGRFAVEYFFAGAQGPLLSKNFVGPQDSDFLISHTLAAEALVWSRCGEDVIMRVNSSVLARTNRNLDDVLMSVDSTDVRSSLVYHVQWRRCQ
jgi:hypothetical protein